MLRSLLLRASTNRWLAERLPRRRFVRRAVQRFMPGETLEDALAAVPELPGEGVGAVLTRLGENVSTSAEAAEVAHHYGAVLKAVQQRDLDAEISVKPTQLGLDQGFPDTLDRLEKLAAHAGRRGSWLWLDMESSPYVDRTLDLYRELRKSHPRVGVCLQAYLRRTPTDLETLLPAGPAVRLVKGAYAEPPELAYPRKEDVDGAFRSLSRRILEARAEGTEVRFAAGTHDTALVGRIDEDARELGLGPGDWEVQMLYGIRREAQARLSRAGHRLRILISYGPAWFPWYMRRLAERPANVGFVLKSLLPGA